jgi:hypothetical protein
MATAGVDALTVDALTKATQTPQGYWRAALAEVVPTAEAQRWDPPNSSAYPWVSRPAGRDATHPAHPRAPAASSAGEDVGWPPTHDRG